MDYTAELQRLKRKQQILKGKKRSYRSKLEKHKHYLLNLRKEGATLEQLQIYLSENRIKCHISTIKRFLDKHQDGQNGS